MLQFKQNYSSFYLSEAYELLMDVPDESVVQVLSADGQYKGPWFSFCVAFDI